MPPAAEGERHLMAVVFLELTGYARLVSENEAKTLGFLKEIEGLLREETGSFKGQLVKFGLDGGSALFQTGVAALSFALKVQQRVATRNAKAPRMNRFHLRMGIHLGDVVMREKDQPVGDAVNIATQIRPLADPGGIAITDTIYYQVKNQLSIKGTFRSVRGPDLPPNLQVFLIPPVGTFFVFWNLGKHSDRVAALILGLLLLGAGAAFYLNRDTSRRMALMTLGTDGDTDSLQVAHLLQEELDQAFAGVPRIQWVGHDGVLYLLSHVPGSSLDAKTVQAAKQGGLKYFLDSRLNRTPEKHWRFKYRILSVRTLAMVGSGTLEAADPESLAQELRRQVTDWAAKAF